MSIVLNVMKRNMIRLYCTCNYCGHFWIVVSYGYSKNPNMKCTKCDDRNVVIKEAQSVNPFGYEENNEETE